MKFATLIAIACPFLMLGCSLKTPSNVRVRIASDKILNVSDFKSEPATAYSSCSVSGFIKFDLSVEPSNFTGMVIGQEASINYAGKWTDNKTEYWITFVEGKQVGQGINIGQYALNEEPQEMKESICATKSSSDIKLVSLGNPEIALSGLKAVEATDKKNN